jgi:hypothetical protein
MNPYEVLGVAPAATRAEIEAAYREMLRAHHPDMHQGESPEQLESAEATTRNLNEAMALVRAGWRPLPGTTAAYQDNGGRWDESFTSGPDHDWFGNPLGPKGAESVDCPLCGLVFAEPIVYRSHLEHDHRIGMARPAATEVRPDRWHWLTFVPAPAFWLCFVLLLYWAAVATFIPWPYSIPPVWLGVLGFGLLLTRAMRDRHT